MYTARLGVRYYVSLNFDNNLGSYYRQRLDSNVEEEHKNYVLNLAEKCSREKTLRESLSWRAIHLNNETLMVR